MSVGQFANFSTDTAFIIIDPLTKENKSGNHMGYLRSLPYLFEQGVAQYTFAPGWLRKQSMKTFDEVLAERDTEDQSWFKYCALPAFQFNYTIIDNNNTASDLVFQHICQITNQDMEEYDNSRTTHKLLQAYLNGRIEEFFLVTDTASFAITDASAHKPLREELDHVQVLQYKEIAKQHLRQEFGNPSLSIGQTLNLWLQRAAAEYEDVMDERPRRIADLFEFDILEPGIRTWDLFEFLAIDFSDDNPFHINATVRPWIESDITKVEENIRNALQEFDYDRDQVRRFRETGERPG